MKALCYQGPSHLHCIWSLHFSEKLGMEEGGRWFSINVLNLQNLSHDLAACKAITHNIDSRLSAGTCAQVLKCLSERDWIFEISWQTMHSNEIVILSTKISEYHLFLWRCTMYVSRVVNYVRNNLVADTDDFLCTFVLHVFFYLTICNLYYCPPILALLTAGWVISIKNYDM